MPWPSALLPRLVPRLWAAWIVGAVSLLLVVSSLWPVTPLAQRDGFAEAVAFVDSEAGSDAFVVVWPPTLAAALAELPAGLNASDAVPFETNDSRRHLRVILLGPAGFDTPPELDKSLLTTRRRFGDLEVATHTYEGGDRVAWDLRAELSQVRLSLSGPEWNVTCDAARADGGWYCPGRPKWNHIGPASLTVAGQAWDCVWAHPIAGHALVIELGQRTLLDRIEVEMALSDGAAALPGGASVLAVLEVDGVGTRRLNRSNARGIARVSLPTKRGTKAAMRLTITTSNDGRRHIGVNVRLVEVRAQ